jgi:hypothetical protein
VRLFPSRTAVVCRMWRTARLETVGATSSQGDAGSVWTEHVPRRIEEVEIELSDNAYRFMLQDIVRAVRSQHYLKSGRNADLTLQ